MGYNVQTLSFRAYIARTPEFKAYFEEDKRIASPKGVVRYETPPGNKPSWIGKKVSYLKQRMGNK